MENERQSDRQQIAKLYSTTKLRSRIEKYEKIFGIPLKPYTKAYFEEAYVSLNEFIDLLSQSKVLTKKTELAEIKKLWENHKETMRDQVKGKQVQEPNR